MSDGNRIIFDDSKHTQNGSTHGVYAGRTLIANNISFNNGGAGIHSYSSAHVDIVNNTGYYNGQVVNYANIYAVDSSVDIGAYEFSAAALVRFPKPGSVLSGQKIPVVQSQLHIQSGNWQVQILENGWRYKINGHGDTYPEIYSARIH